MRMMLVMSILLAIAAGCNGVPKAREPVRPPTLVEPEPEFKSEFDRLIWLLGNKNFSKRREAQAKLVAMGSDILPDLEKAAAAAADPDRRRQIEIVMAAMDTPQRTNEKKGILVKLSMEKKVFAAGEPVEVTLEVRNVGEAPLEMTVPLLRKRSVSIRLDWVADMSFMSEGKLQDFYANGTKRDEWLSEPGWSPSVITVRPGDSIREVLDITDNCMRAARYKATATYRWEGTGDFMSNAVTFEVKKPAGGEEKQEPQDADK
jgi:hypothetical protein